MPRIPFLAALVFAGTAMTAKAQVMDESECQLRYLRGTQSGLAISQINAACNFLSTWSSSFELNRQERAYNECLLRELVGVQNDQAAALVAQACRRQASSRRD